MTVYEVEGNHISMLDSKKVAAAINGEPLDEETFKANLNIVSPDMELHGKNANFM